MKCLPPSSPQTRRRLSTCELLLSCVLILTAFSFRLAIASFCLASEMASPREELTYVMIKPDGVQRGCVGEIISRFERRGFQLVALKMQTSGEQLLQQHYGEHVGKPFFAGLVKYMQSGPVVCMVWKGLDVVRQARKMIGATKPCESDPGEETAARPSAARWGRRARLSGVFKRQALFKRVRRRRLCRNYSRRPRHRHGPQPHPRQRLRRSGAARNRLVVYDGRDSKVGAVCAELALRVSAEPSTCAVLSCVNKPPFHSQV